MKQFFWIAMSVVVATLILFGCKGSDGAAGPQGPPGTALTGNYHGKVRLFDALGNLIFDSRGVTVSVEGTSLTGVSDSVGKFVILGIPTGTYTFDYVKAAFGTMKQEQVQFVGGGDFYSNGTVTLSNLPTFEPLTATNSISAGTITVSGTVSGTPAIGRSVYMFIGRASGVSASNPQTYFTVYGGFIPASTNPYSIDVSISNLTTNYGFISGETVYFAVYSVTPVNPGYIDFASGNFVYSSVGISPKSTSAVIP